MKIAVNQLRRIIREEVQKVTLTEGHEVGTVGYVVDAAGLDPRKFMKVMDKKFSSLYDSKLGSRIRAGGIDIQLTPEEHKAFWDPMMSRSSAKTPPRDSGLDIGGPEVEMTTSSGDDAFVIADFGDTAESAARHMKKAAAWCASKRRDIDFSAANGIVFVTESDMDEDSYEIQFLPDPKVMAASFKAAASFLTKNSGSLIHIDID
jgi:hypothetical protein